MAKKAQTTEKPPGLGHNIKNESAERLRSYIERVERLEEEKKGLASDIKDIYAEAKSAGFDVKVMRALVRERKTDAMTMEEFLTLLDVYRKALGMGSVGL